MPFMMPWGCGLRTCLLHLRKSWLRLRPRSANDPERRVEGPIRHWAAGSGTPTYCMVMVRPIPYLLWAEGLVVLIRPGKQKGEGLLFGPALALTITARLINHYRKKPALSNRVFSADNDYSPH